MERTTFEDDNSRISTIGTIRHIEDEEKSVGESAWRKEIYKDKDIVSDQEGTSQLEPDQSLQLQLPPHRTLERLAQKNVKPMDQISMTIGPPVILFFDLVVPCIIYYVWLHSARSKWATSCNAAGISLNDCENKPSHNDWILGLSVVSFGFGEIYILLVRVIRLIKYHSSCSPLLSKHWLELDATSWVYLASLIIPLIAFIVSTNLHSRVLPWLYLFAPGFLMAFLALISLITLIPIKIPVRINSDPRGSRMKPLVYYAAEDFIAVDGWQGREFRTRFGTRYEQSRMFRRFFLYLTIFWIAGATIYVGVLAAIIRNLEFEYAFGVSFGVLFSYITIWASTTFAWVSWEMGREKRAFEEGDKGF
jgi:hypothetical protein